MTIFAILSAPGNLPLRTAIEGAFTGHNLLINDGQWLIAGEGTAKEISDKLGITEGKVGSALVLAVSGYFGRARTDIWEWIAAKLKA